VYILKCNSFDNEVSARYSNKCCNGKCHQDNELINVTPYAADATLPNRNLDWSLGIQGLVCCGRYEFVRSLSREWWIRKLAAIENWSLEEVRIKLSQGSWHKTFDKPRSVVVVKPKVKVTSVNCPQCGARWNEQVCEDCGWIG